VISVAKGISTKIGIELIQKRGEDIWECIREGSKGELPMPINSINFLKIILVYEPYIFLLSVPKSNH